MPDPLRDVPDDGIELIKSFEGIPDGDPSTVNFDAYLDPVGIWTIGWGHAITHRGDFLRGAANKAVARALYPGGITLAQAEALLRGDLVDTAAAVNHLVKVDLDDGQFGALVSFAFNLGTGNLSKSTLLRLLNAGDVAGAADQFLVWNKGRVHGVLQPLAGLTRRRRAERALFLGEDWRAAGARGAPPEARKAPKMGKLPKSRGRSKTPKAPKMPKMPKTPRGAGSARAARPGAQPATARGRTTTPKAPSQAAPAKPRGRQKRP
jgi:lysozyme